MSDSGKYGVATSKYVRLSPKRSRREIAGFAKKPVARVMNELSFVCSKAARQLLKTIKSAASNCEFKHGARMENMLLWTIQVDEGPKLKRSRPRNKGRTSPILKPTVHIKAIVRAEAQ